ncbi:MAG: DCC1-like thiol-disulfide oxidoreductase family protein [bacterium]|nr:DCC1-like thiol-disulfide oxidoreductase family protein [bacterium]
MQDRWNLPYTKWQFGIFRILFGIYLSVHFLNLIPFAKDIWSSSGMLPDASMNLTYGMFPNILYLFDSPVFITVFMVFLSVLSILYTFGVQRRIVSLLLWFGWACLFHRNNLISNPGIPMIGWLLLATSIIPTGEALIFGNWKGKNNWQLPKELFFGAWAILAVAYTVSGIDKFFAPSWQDGTAIFHLLHNPLARDWFLRDLFLLVPMFYLKLLTWGALVLEIGFVGLCIFRKTRFLAWLAIMGMHIGILSLVDFPDLTFGVLIIHIFTIDPIWFLNKKDNKERIVFFDGVCGLCNGWVDFLLDIDSNSRLKFSPLQGEKAKLSLKGIQEQLDTVVYYKNHQVFTKSTAILEILKDMGGLWSLIYIFKVIPKVFRDALYKAVSKNRYKLFGQSDACRMPSSDERKRFI